jgi:hypothetical protein
LFVCLLVCFVFFCFVCFVCFFSLSFFMFCFVNYLPYSITLQCMLITTVGANSDTEEWQAVATVVLLLSQTWTLMNNKQWLQSCYCCHNLGHWGMTSSGYNSNTIVATAYNSSVSEFVTTVTRP